MWPRKGSYEGWEQVAETSQLFEAELMALRLREAGIEADVIDQSFKQEPLPNVRSFAVVRVLVPSDKAGEAREILAHPVDLSELASDAAEDDEQ
jgi:hypothetical protein